MKRQTSSIEGGNLSPAKRKRRRPTLIFFVLQVLAVLGPLGFSVNIIYFHFYFHQTNKHIQHHEGHPLHHISKSVQTRYEHSQKIAGKLQSPREIVLQGDSVLQRMHGQVLEGWDQCGKSTKSAVALRKKLTSSEAQRGYLRSPDNDEPLQPFALKETLEKYFLSLNNGTSSNEKSNRQRDKCFIPQPGSSECNVTTYSVLVSYYGDENFRVLFTNLLSWVTYYSVSEIIVLMPLDAWAAKGAMDAKYKQRIKSWHEDTNHVVTMIALPNAIDPDPSSKNSLHSLFRRVRLFLTSKAILFMDGTSLWTGNEKGLTAGFELWKQNPYGMVASHKLLQQATSQRLSCPKQSQEFDSIWAPFCLLKEKKETDVPDNIDMLYNQYQDIMDLSGVFVHSEFLCLARQTPMLTALYHDGWKALATAETGRHNMVKMRSVLAIGLLHISGTPPLLYPARISRPKNETRHIHENWHYLAPSSETKKLQEVMAQNRMYHERVLLSMLAYFGTALSTKANDAVIPYWCESHKRADDKFYMEDIMWIEPDGHQYELCSAGSVA